MAPHLNERLTIEKGGLIDFDQSHRLMHRVSFNAEC